MIRHAILLCATLTLAAAAHPAAAEDFLRDDGTLRYRFYTDWELLYVERDGTQSVEFVYEDRLAPPVGSAAFRDVLDGDDVVDDDEELGGRGVIGLRLNPTSAIEVVATGFTHGRSAQVRRPAAMDLFAFEAPDPQTLGSPINDFAFDAASAFDLDYDSEFYSGEINYRHAFQVEGADYRFNFLAGVRALRLEEDLRLTSTKPGTFGILSFVDVGNYDIATRNTLIGAQLGGEAIIPLLDDRLEFDLYGVGGMYANRSDVRSTFQSRTFLFGTSSHQDSRSEWDEAGVIEAAAHFTVRLYRGLELKMGYRAIYLLDVAAAPDQFPRSGAPSDFFGNAYDDDAKTIFHGPSLGLKVVF